jgi:uncharacterized protein
MTTTTAFDAAQSPPVPQASDLNRFYWDAVNEHRLELLRCQSCGHYVHYPRPICNRCQSDQVAPEEISGRGTLYSYTLIMQASHPYFVDKVPYLIAIVAIDEEPEIHIPTGLVDCEESDLRCDMPVEVVYQEVTPTLTLPFFRPIK